MFIPRSFSKLLPVANPQRSPFPIRMETQEPSRTAMKHISEKQTSFPSFFFPALFVISVRCNKTKILAMPLIIYINNKQIIRLLFRSSIYRFLRFNCEELDLALRDPSLLIGVGDLLLLCWALLLEAAKEVGEEMEGVEEAVTTKMIEL